MSRAARSCGAVAFLLLAMAVPAAAQKSGGAVLPGGNSKQPISIEAAKLDYFDKEQKLIYTGSVVAVQGDSKLKSSVLTIFLAPKTASKGGGGETTGGASTNQIQRMLATGPVTLIQKDQVGTGDNGVYDKLANTVILTGNVVLSQGPNVTKGDRLVYDLKTGHATVSGGRVVGMFTPASDTPAGDSAGGATEPETRRAGRRSSSR